MTPFLKTCCCLFLTLTLPSTKPTTAANTTPAPMQAFQLPTSDGKTATAIIALLQTGDTVLIYQNSPTTFSLLKLGPTSPPGPTPPSPTPPPTPAVLTKTTKLAIIENVTTTPPELRSLFASQTWRTRLKAACTFIGIIPNDILDPNTNAAPAALKPFLDACKTATLPAAVIQREDGSIAILGDPRNLQFPESTNHVTTPQTPPVANRPATCTDGNCCPGLLSTPTRTRFLRSRD